MSTTTAKKKRLKHAREGSRNPELQRLDWNGINPVSKRTPTLMESKERHWNKHKDKRNRNLHQGDDSFLMIPSFAKYSCNAVTSAS
jgi:hypothetical protein